MKNYIKGIITGIIIGVVVCSLPALADTIDALFNQVRISVNGVDQIQWGEDIKLSDGAETPASILYNGTTYLPMRKLGELSGNKIYWNGDSRTVGMTGAQKDIKVIAEKPDKNGNVWKYYTFNSSGEYNSIVDYLGIKDEVRGYERVYRCYSNVHVMDDGVYFVGRKDDTDYRTATAGLIKISFDSDESTQDGEEIYRTHYSQGGFNYATIIDDDYLFTSHSKYTNGEASIFVIYNYKERKMSSFTAGNRAAATYGNVYDIENKENEIIVRYEVNKYEYHGLCYEIVFDKATNKFGKPIEIEKRVIEETE